MTSGKQPEISYVATQQCKYYFFKLREDHPPLKALWEIVMGLFFHFQRLCSVCNLDIETLFSRYIKVVSRGCLHAVLLKASLCRWRFLVSWINNVIAVLFRSQELLKDIEDMLNSYKSTHCSQHKGYILVRIKLWFCFCNRYKNLFWHFLIAFPKQLYALFSHLSK